MIKRALKFIFPRILIGLMLALGLLGGLYYAWAIINPTEAPGSSGTNEAEDPGKLREYVNDSIGQDGDIKQDISLARNDLNDISLQFSKFGSPTDADDSTIWGKLNQAYDDSLELTAILGVPTDGVCGSADDSSPQSAPTANLCSAGAATAVAGSGPWTWSCAGLNGGATVACGTHVPQVNPTGLSLSQTANNRLFTVSWTAGSGNGGAGGCKLQYQKDGTTWTDLTGTYNCDANTSGASASLPSTSGWTNNFNATGVSVRLVLVSDTTLAGSFTQKATCSSAGGSASATPNVDENCNGQWDDSALGWSILTGANTWNSASCNDDSRNGGTRHGYGGSASGWNTAWTDCQTACNGLSQTKACLYTNVWNHPSYTRGTYMYCTCGGSVVMPTGTSYTLDNVPEYIWVYSYAEKSTLYY